MHGYDPATISSKDAMKSTDFEVLKRSIEAKHRELRELQRLYRHETGVEYLPGVSGVKPAALHTIKGAVEMDCIWSYDFHPFERSTSTYPGCDASAQVVSGDLMDAQKNIVATVWRHQLPGGLAECVDEWILEELRQDAEDRAADAAEYRRETIMDAAYDMMDAVRRMK